MMPTVSEKIPELLQPEVDAALAWFNSKEEDEFKVTGIVDAELTLGSSEPRELRLVLCGGNTCRQQTFRISNSSNGYHVSCSETPIGNSTELQAELDPPPGARRDWLDLALSKHKFVILIFYRGFW